MDAQKDIELRSEKCRNIVGKIFPRLLRIGGTTVISIILLLALVLAYLIPYPQYKTYPIQIYSYPMVQTEKTPLQGIISVNMKENNVQKGELTCTLTTETDSVFHFNAGINGQLYYNYKNNDYVERNNIIFSIIPDSIESFYGIILVPIDEILFINKNQEVTIIYNKQTLNGNVSYVYPIPILNQLDGNMSNKVEIRLMKNPQDNDNAKQFLLLNSNVHCKVLISNEPILKSVLKKTVTQ